VPAPHGRPHNSAAHTENVHIVALDSLLGGEMVMNQTCPTQSPVEGSLVIVNQLQHSLRPPGDVNGVQMVFGIRTRIG
jgi:hypothetical protein